MLQRSGYRSEFVYGGESHFDNMRGFFLGNGFNSVVDRQDFAAPKFVGSWGVSDEDLFDMAHARIRALHAGGQPFFMLVFSSTNHTPFEFPDGRIELFDAQKQTVHNAVKYADHALGSVYRARPQRATTGRTRCFWSSPITTRACMAMSSCRSASSTSQA